MEIKGWYIGVGVVVAAVVMFVASIISANNTAIGYDEAIKSAKSGIQVQEKREYDLVTKLVQVVEADSRYEKETLLAVVQARAALKSGNVAQAVTAISVVAEQYPALKATESYTQLMTELAVSENLKTQYRTAYNDTVQEYNRFVRRFPNKTFLDWSGYDVQSYDYLEFTETQLPAELFSNP